MLLGVTPKSRVNFLMSKCWKQSSGGFPDNKAVTVKKWGELRHMRNVKF